MPNSELFVVDGIESRIVSARGQNVIFDRELAALYGVDTRTFNQAIKRNVERFPNDFMFQLTADEKNQLLASHPQLTYLKFSKTAPHVFTEHGAIMAASLLNSPRAVEASIFVVRAFVKLRQLLTAHKELAHKVAELERKLGDHDEAIQAIVAAIKQLAAPPAEESNKRKIGFGR